MIRRTIAVLVGVASTAPVGMLFAQERIGVRSAVLFESYSFDAGLPFRKVSELTIPIRPSRQRVNVVLHGGHIRRDTNDGGILVARYRQGWAQPAPYD